MHHFHWVRGDIGRWARVAVEGVHAIAVHHHQRRSFRLVEHRRAAHGAHGLVVDAVLLCDRDADVYNRHGYAYNT